MNLFKIDPKRSLEHDLRKIDRQFIPRILEAIEILSENPFPVQFHFPQPLTQWITDPSS